MKSTVKAFQYMIVVLLLCFSLSSCEQQDLSPPGAEYGIAVIKDFSSTPNVKIALFKEAELDSGQKIELSYGAMDASFIILDDVEYMVDWNDLDDFKNLKRGEKMHFRSNGYVARMEKTGKVYRVVMLNVL